MKATIAIPLLLALASCTTVKKDDHSYTYIHTLNNNTQSSESPISTKKPKIRREVELDDDAPFYSKGFSSVDDIRGDLQYVQEGGTQPSPQPNVVHNHYYAENGVERPQYQIPPAYSGRLQAFNPAGRRFLMRAEVLNSN